MDFTEKWYMQQCCIVVRISISEFCNPDTKWVKCTELLRTVGLENFHTPILFRDFTILGLGVFLGTNCV